MASLNWYGDEVRRKIRAEMERRIDACCRLVLNHARGLISIPGTTKALKRMEYWYGGEKRTANRKQNVYGSAVSEPGEPPRKQFGHLRRSVATERTGLVGRVGTNVKYGRWLELGTKKMAPRPWLRRSLNECRDKIRQILGKPMV